MVQAKSGIALALVAALSVLVSAVSCESKAPNGRLDRSASNLAVFERAWTVVDKYFYDPKFNGVDWSGAKARYQSLAEAARTDSELYSVMTRMTGELKDSHTRVMPPDQAKRFKQGEIANWGFRLVPNASDPVVSYVFAGSPADAAGVEPGWRVRSLNGAPYDPFSPMDARKPASLAFTDAQGAERRLSIGPYRHDLSALRVERLDKAVMVSIPGVTLGMTKDFQKRIEGLDRSAPMIIDVRGAPGGYGEELARFMGCILPKDALLSSTRTRNRQWKDTRVRGCKSRWTGPIAVLIDHGTASAAEVLAASVKTHGRGVLVGARTAGAVTGGDFADLPDGGGLVVARFDFRDAGRRRLEGSGVEPDVAVTTTGADRRAGRDPARDKAVAILTSSNKAG